MRYASEEQFVCRERLGGLLAVLNTQDVCPDAVVSKHALSPSDLRALLHSHPGLTETWLAQHQWPRVSQLTIDALLQLDVQERVAVGCFGPAGPAGGLVGETATEIVQDLIPLETSPHEVARETSQDFSV
jgi:hypothetical protein